MVGVSGGWGLGFRVQGLGFRVQGWLAFLCKAGTCARIAKKGTISDTLLFPQLASLLPNVGTCC